ncbi:tetratricopeptide repeat protein [Streptomyces bathyalis]|uniref:tetratricopeptide repeat protein n=1 Tax=Streptomyces bathyalis TaxID=2710756 RepID=UPI001FE70159|nr:tetratricopeptide repeat protein [Streptomyces bathyalis]
MVHTTVQGDAELAEAWAAVNDMGDPSSGLPRLAHALIQRATQRPEFETALMCWLREHGTSDRTRRQSANTISGSAQLHGPTVQAGQVHGGIHFHTTPDRQQQPIPHELPPFRAHFVDRDQDLAALNELRASHPASAVQLLVVTGLPGVGKTALVSRWLHQRARQDFGDGELYVDLGGYSPTGPVSPGDVLEHLLRAVGATALPPETSERAALWRSLTSGLRLAVMLDNAVTAAQVRPLLPAGPGSLVAVTSRSHLSGLLVDGASLHQLEALVPEAGVELLTQSGGGPRIGQDPGAAQAIVTLCAGLPLALCLAAAQLAIHPRRSLSTLVTALSQGDGPLEALRVDGQAAVRAALDESYRLLPSAVAEIYRCLGVLPARHYDQELVAAACAQPVHEVERALQNLVESNLLEEAGDNGSYRFHDLVLPHAQQRGEAEETTAARQEILRRYVDWCLDAATTAEGILTPSHRNLARSYSRQPAEPIGFSEPAAALEWLDSHRASLMAAVRHSADAGWHASCWQLVDAMWPLFLRLRPTEMWIEAHTVGLTAAQRDGDRQAVGRMLTSGGNGLRNAGRHREAVDWYTQALCHAEEDNDPRQQAQALNGLGNAHLALHQLREAEEHFVRALALREEIGYRRGAALSRVCLAETALERGDHQRALQYLTRAHTDLVAEEDTYDAARSLALLGHTTALHATYEQGVGHLLEALEDFHLSGSLHWQGRTLEMLGEAAEHHGDAQEARRYYSQAREVYLPISPTDTNRLEGRLRHLKPPQPPPTTPLLAEVESG